MLKIKSVDTLRPLPGRRTRSNVQHIRPPKRKNQKRFCENLQGQWARNRNTMQPQNNELPRCNPESNRRNLQAISETGRRDELRPRRVGPPSNHPKTAPYCRGEADI